jgi:cyclophilin family peptidyl-prolyl cis-trans isomerase
VLTSANLPQAQFAQMMQQLELNAKNWQEELEARKRDAAGEPLPQAKIVTTKGDIIVELFENEAPEAVANFIYLAEKGFYDYLDFFLVIQHLAAQAGCPNEDGTGGPGYMIQDEYEKPNARKVFRGSLVLATLKEKANSGGSQFYIPMLPPMENYTKLMAFGRVLSGMQNIASLNQVDPKKKKEEDKEKTEPALPADEIIRIEIIRKRNHTYEPTRLPLVR